MSTDSTSTAAPPTSGWQAKLNCSFEAAPNRTVVRREHSGPLSIQRPFYPDGDVAHVYLLHPPGGVVGGDRLNINIRCTNGAAGLITTPGAGKFYRSERATATVEQSLKADGGSLEWFPQENIFYDGCDVNIHTKIELESDATLAWWEINCFGNTQDANSFNNSSVSTVFDFYKDSQLLLRDRLVIDEHHSHSASCGLRGHSVSGTLVLTPMHQHCIDQVRSHIANLDGFCTTCFDSLLVVRYLGASAEDAKQGFIQIWSLLRYALNQRQPILPRIWAT